MLVFQSIAIVIGNTSIGSNAKVVIKTERTNLPTSTLLYYDDKKPRQKDSLHNDTTDIQYNVIVWMFANVPSPYNCSLLALPQIL